MMGKAQLLSAPAWDANRLKAGLKKAMDSFRQERMKEPLEEYLDRFEESQDTLEELLEETVDLTQLSERAIEKLGDRKLQLAVRYLSGPPVSLDDLKMLASASLSLKQLQADPKMAARIIETVLLGLDRRRFPWVSEGREATEAERRAAVLASAALIATQKVATARRNERKTTQEGRTKEALRGAGFREMPARTVATLGQAPQPGEFCGESKLGGRKADLVARLGDERVMPIECKVSNSSTNSIKRVNNDAAAKATTWLKKFGTEGVVVPVLSGVYKLKNLDEAQAGGFGIFWAHDLQALVEWIETTRQRAQRGAR